MIKPCEPPEAWGFHCREEATASFTAASLRFHHKNPPLHLICKDLMRSYFLWGPVNQISHIHGLSLASTTYSPAPGSLVPWHRVVPPVCYWGNSLYWLITAGTSQQMNSTMNQVERVSAAVTSVCQSKNKSYLFSKIWRLHIHTKETNSDSVMCTHIPISKILQTCICIFFILRECIKVF